MLYVFAGLKRKNSVADFLRKKAAKFHIQVEVHEVDIQRSKRMDLTNPKVQKRLLQAIDAGVYDAVILTPPCSTFSRAVWANDRGPYALRSFLCPWNTRPRREKAQVGNILGDFSYEALKRQLQHPNRFGLMEQPENLGRVKKMRVPGHWPASMWQFQQHGDLLKQFPGLKSVVLAHLRGSWFKPKRPSTRIWSKACRSLTLMDGILDRCLESQARPSLAMMVQTLQQQHRQLGRHCCAAGWPRVSSSRFKTVARGKEDRNKKRRRRSRRKWRKRKTWWTLRIPRFQEEMGLQENAGGKDTESLTTMVVAWGHLEGGTMK